MYKVVIWGTGGYYKKYKNRFSDCNIVAVVDNDKNKQGLSIDSYKIIMI